MFNNLREKYKQYKQDVAEYNKDYKQYDTYKENYDQLDLKAKEELKKDLIIDSKEEFMMYGQIALVVIGILLVLGLLIWFIVTHVDFKSITSKYLNFDISDIENTNNGTNSTSNTNNTDLTCDTMFNASYKSEYYSDNNLIVEEIIFYDVGNVTRKLNDIESNGTYTIDDGKIIVSIDGGNIVYTFKNSCNYLTRLDNEGMEILFEKE